jgi:hypothetical protein
MTTGSTSTNRDGTRVRGLIATLVGTVYVDTAEVKVTSQILK